MASEEKRGLFEGRAAHGDDTISIPPSFANLSGSGRVAIDISILSWNLA